MKEIPSEDFVTKFRARYENEFLRLEALKNKEGDSSADELSENEREKLRLEYGLEPAASIKSSSRKSSFKSEESKASDGEKSWKYALKVKNWNKREPEVYSIEDPFGTLIFNLEKRG